MASLREVELSIFNLDREVDSQYSEAIVDGALRIKDAKFKSIKVSLSGRGAILGQSLTFENGVRCLPNCALSAKPSLEGFRFYEGKWHLEFEGRANAGSGTVNSIMLPIDIEGLTPWMETEDIYEMCETAFAILKDRMPELKPEIAPEPLFAELDPLDQAMAKVKLDEIDEAAPLPESWGEYA